MQVEFKTLKVYRPFLERSRYKFAKGGRAAGRSHFFAESLIERHLMTQTRSVCVREYQNSISDSVKSLLEVKIQHYGLQDFFSITKTEITDKNGGRIIFRGLKDHTAESIKSLEGTDVCWIEEGRNISQTSLDKLIPTIMRKAGAEMWCSYNPEEPTDPIDLLALNPPAGSIVIHSTYQDNLAFLDKQFVSEEIEPMRERDFDKFNWIYLGNYRKQSQATVFKNWEVKEFESDAGADFRFGADWGFSVDPTVLIRCYISGRILYVDYEAHMVGCEIDKLPDLFDTVPRCRDFFITADSARPETISYLRNHGFPRIVPAVKGPKSIEEGIEFLKSFDIVVHPRCGHLIQELKTYSYRYELDQMTGEIKISNQLEDKNNHVIDALRYACENARKLNNSAKVDNYMPPVVNLSWK
jgi:phage terminase large subunit